MLTVKQFETKFGGFMLNGLDSKQTYIPLRQVKKSGINLAIRPLVDRISSELILFGAKLRVGFTLDENHTLVKTNVVDISPTVAVDRLKDFCKGFSWINIDPRRFSTILGFASVAGIYDRDILLKKMDEEEITHNFINTLETQYKQYNSNIRFQNKGLIVAALDASWKIQVQNLFYGGTDVGQSTTPEIIIGESSKLLNQANETKYDDNVVSFKDKVATMAADAAEADNSE